MPNQLKLDVEHPEPLPLNLAIVPILKTIDEDDMVLDPFCGSGTNGKISNSIGRRFGGVGCCKST